jgi:hypothetical protein
VVDVGMALDHQCEFIWPHPGQFKLCRHRIFGATNQDIAKTVQTICKCCRLGVVRIFRGKAAVDQNTFIRICPDQIPAYTNRAWPGVNAEQPVVQHTERNRPSFEKMGIDRRRPL